MSTVGPDRAGRPAGGAARRTLSVVSAAREEPQRTALIEGEREWTFLELAHEVRGALARLRDLAVAPGGELSRPPVALVGLPRRQSLIALYGLWELPRPVVLLHPRATAVERRRLLSRVSPAAVLDEDWEPAAMAAEGGGSAAPEPIPTGTDTVVFTSGSDAEPKGVVLSRRALAAAAAASHRRLGWAADDRWLLSLPIAHVGGLSIVTRCLAARRPVVLAREARFDPAAFARQVRRHRITLVSLVPTMLRRLLDLRPAWLPPEHLRAVLLGGAPAPPDLLVEAVDRGVPVLTTYGLSEACSQVATQLPGTVNRGELGCGPPLPGVEVRVRDGEIEVRGETLMSGYWPIGESRQPFLDGGWLPTGDLGELDGAGNLHVHGRRSELLITGGENVHPAEVEAVLTAHPALVGACVFGVEDREWGQQVAAALVAGSSGAPEDASLLALLRDRLAPFKRPRRIAYMNALPLLANGKTDRRAAGARALPHLRPL